MWAPGLADQRHRLRRGCHVERLQQPIAFADAEIVHRQDVRSGQAVDQEHLYRPATDAFQRAEPCDEFVVGHSTCGSKIRHHAAQRGGSDAADRLDLACRETAGTHRVEAGVQQLRRRRKRLLRMQRQQSREDRVARLDVQLLIGHRAHQCLERFARGLRFVPAGAELRDQPRPVSVDRRQILRRIDGCRLAAFHQDGIPLVNRHNETSG